MGGLELPRRFEVKTAIASHEGILDCRPEAQSVLVLLVFEEPITAGARGLPQRRTAIAARHVKELHLG